MSEMCRPIQPGASIAGSLRELARLYLQGMTGAASIRAADAQRWPLDEAWKSMAQAAFDSLVTDQEQTY